MIYLYFLANCQSFFSKKGTLSLSTLNIYFKKGLKELFIFLKIKKSLGF